MGQTNFSAGPVAAYGVVLLMCAFAWEIERQVLLRCHDADSSLSKALRGNRKEIVSLATYVLAIALSLVNPWVACALYGAASVIWLIPDRRIERTLRERL